MSEIWKVYWPIFERLEVEFGDLAFSIALADSHLSVYSTRLSELLLRSCTECENAAKSLCIERNLAAETDIQRLTFPQVADAICQTIPLYSKELLIIWPYQSLTATEIRPFENWQPKGSTNPDWFKAYNAVKHDRIGNAKDGNLKNVMHALGGLFILNLWLREEDIRKVSEHFNLLDRRLMSYSKFFSPQKFLKRTAGGNYGNLVLS